MNNNTGLIKSPPVKQAGFLLFLHLQGTFLKGLMVDDKLI
jgi:hypothetical protein